MANEVDVWDMSDEELEAAFREAKFNGDTVDHGEPEESSDELDAFAGNDEEDEEVEVDNLEQPDEDSDDDASSDDEDEVELDEDSETEEDTPDGETESDEEQTEDGEDEESEEDEQPEQTDKGLEDFLNVKTKARANGVDYEFSNKEKLEMFGKIFGQAMDYTKKTQAIKESRKTLDIIQQAGLTNEDLNLMADVLKGDKDAIATVMKRTGVDALDLDTENSNYVTKDYGRNDTELAIRDIVEEISVDREYVITQNVLDKQWDDTSRAEFVKDPSMIKALHIDVKDGTFDKVNPIAQKMKIYDGGRKSDLEYYLMAGQQYTNNQKEAAANAKAEADRAKAEKVAQRAKVDAVKAEKVRQESVKQNSAKRKAAAPTKRGTGTKTAIDYLDDSDEAFEEWLNSVKEAQ